jgi:chemotaxis protein MotB
MDDSKKVENNTQENINQDAKDPKVGTKDKNHFAFDPSFFGADQEEDPFSDAILLEVPVQNKDRWAVSWSDLMMTMFILFAVLYIYQTGHRNFEFRPDREKAQTEGQNEKSEEPLAAEKMPSHIFEQAKSAIQDEFINDATSVEFIKDKAVRISIASDLLFDVGNAQLKTSAKYQLKQIANVLNQSDLTINVAGHTDITPIHSALYPTNWELSAARACEVARFMIESCGVEGSRFFLTAYSYHMPIKKNDSRKNRALNRRVDIILMKGVPLP